VRWHAWRGCSRAAVLQNLMQSPRVTDDATLCWWPTECSSLTSSHSARNRKGTQMLIWWWPNFSSGNCNVSENEGQPSLVLKIDTVHRHMWRDQTSGVSVLIARWHHSLEQWRVPSSHAMSQWWRARQDAHQLLYDITWPTCCPQSKPLCSRVQGQLSADRGFLGSARPTSLWMDTLPRLHSQRLKMVFLTALGGLLSCLFKAGSWVDVSVAGVKVHPRYRRHGTSDIRLYTSTISIFCPSSMCFSQRKLSMEDFRGITLMSLAAKLYRCMLFNRIYHSINPLLWPQQAGFWWGCSCVEQNHNLWQTMEGFCQKQLTLVCTFVDLSFWFYRLTKNVQDTLTLWFTV